MSVLICWSVKRNSACFPPPVMEQESCYILSFCSAMFYNALAPAEQTVRDNKKYSYGSFGITWGFPGDRVVKNPPANGRDTGSIPGLERFPGVKNDNPLQCFLPVKSHGQRNSIGYSPWGYKESDTAEWLSHACMHTHWCHCLNIFNLNWLFPLERFQLSACSCYFLPPLKQKDGCVFMYVWVPVCTCIFNKYLLRAKNYSKYCVLEIQ